jgi:NAD(P)H-dependent FMN reductase
MENSDLSILVILGTGREGRASDQAATFVHKLVAATGAKTELVDVRDSGLTATHADWMDDGVFAADWIAKANSADGFVIVSPEYNNFFPGELKMFLDQTLKPYARKPAGLVGTSNGQWGGTRVVEELRVYVSRLGMVAVQPPAYFPNVQDAFDKSGSPVNPQLAEFTQPMINEVLWYAKALKSARES